LKILFDVNVILDVLLARKDFVQVSSRLMGMVERKKIQGYLCATTITTLDYLMSKALTKNQARIEIKKLLMLFEIAEVNSKVLELSADSIFSDFEDAFQYFSGTVCEVDGIVTRNIKDYKNAQLPVYAPEELWGILTSTLSDPQ
jgi:predicted nucleic acid-binding protein